MRWSVAVLVLVFGVLGAPPALADEQQVVDSCVATVPAGSPIALNPLAVLEPITDLLGPLDPLDVLTPVFRSVWAAQPPIPLSASPSGISGPAIADAVLARLANLPVLSPVLDALTAPLRARLAMTCGIAITPRVASGAGTATFPAKSTKPAVPEPPAVQPAPQPTAGVTVLPPQAPAEPGPRPGAATPPAGGAEPSAEGRDLMPLAVASVPASVGQPEGEPGSHTGVLLLAGLLNLLVGVQLGRVWALRRPAAGVRSSGRSARPLDPTVVP
ncbi:hypothetical protein HFP15_31725 [Amycolatopsis sp. K13G38]|uniref:Uncharacterized protein n=1 Tax=Amycolatopsis acididurans TaxID=2724524 RepID=A0ABX1JF09_9PSEU|nr:hypothetical protein [Amycolatopsis acididurans]NKQ57444.1 hypothetical protein [Amycolatopsis acididurans]